MIIRSFNIEFIKIETNLAKIEKLLKYFYTKNSTNLTTTVVNLKAIRRKYLEDIIDIDDNFNMFKLVANSFMRIISGLSKKLGYLHSKLIGEVRQKYVMEALSRQNYILSNSSTKD